MSESREWIKAGLYGAWLGVTLTCMVCVFVDLGHIYYLRYGSDGLHNLAFALTDPGGYRVAQTKADELGAVGVILSFMKALAIWGLQGAVWGCFLSLIYKNIRGRLSKMGMALWKMVAHKVYVSGK
jgi:hypothetical protein